MREPACVGALVADGRHRIFAQRRTPHRRVLPGIWDVVGGHIEPGETPEQALSRELTEETGWQLARIDLQVADWEWEWEGVVRRELDYLVTVTGDLGAPRLEEGKHDAYAWVGPDGLDLLMAGRTDADRRLRDVVAKAVRTRLTDRLRLEPVGPGHSTDLVHLYRDPDVAFWYGGGWGREEALRSSTSMGERWESDGVSKWMVYDRSDGTFLGRGGLSAMAAGAEVTSRIESVLGARGRAWARHRLELGLGAGGLGARTRQRHRAGPGRSRVRVRHARGRGGGRLHRTPQHPLPRGDGTARDGPRRRDHRRGPRGRQAGCPCRCAAGGVRTLARARRDVDLCEVVCCCVGVHPVVGGGVVAAGGVLWLRRATGTCGPLVNDVVRACRTVFTFSSTRSHEKRTFSPRGLCWLLPS